MDLSVTVPSLFLFETAPGLFPACRPRAYHPAPAGQVLRAPPSRAPGKSLDPDTTSQFARPEH
jgi:hypothetical protein